MKQLVLAFQFLTIIPLKVKGGVTEREIAQSALFFPVVGAFQGLLAVCAGSVFLRVFPPEIAGGLILVIFVISNGGFHLDGLADTFDALAVKSKGDREADREKRLAVMKDSSTGAMGVTAIAIAVLLKFLLINSLVLRSPHSLAFSMLFLMPVLSKWGMVAAMYRGKPARGDGLGKLFLDNITAGTVFSSSLVTVLVCILVTALNSGKTSVINAVALPVVLLAACSLFSFLSAKFCMRRFGGLTGDNFGAINELSEILFLMVVIIWFQSSIW